MEKNKQITEQQARTKLMTLCARSEHSSGEILQKMRLWGLSDEAQARVMEKLIADKFVDDERFTRAFVNDKIQFNSWGRRKIEQALWAKGVDKSIQQKVLDEVPEEDYLRVLRPLLKSKQRSISARNDFERQMKLIRFAQSRGFSMDQIEKSLEI
ncbi:MAG: RecX family transcriptional regulator [Prevotella sp.]|nr:RecX family transcriptional regulator [Prevotella sp.]